MVWSTVLRWTVLPRLLAPVIDTIVFQRGLPRRAAFGFEALIGKLKVHDSSGGVNRRNLEK